MTEREEDVFWDKLLRAVDEARHQEGVASAPVHSDGNDSMIQDLDADTLADDQIAAAERLLAAIDAEHPEPLDPVQVEALVAGAVAGTRLRPASRMRRFFAAAAALFLTPVFLVGAGTAVTVVSVILHNTRDTLSFSDAVRYLVSDSSTEVVKNPALGNVAGRLKWAIDHVRAVEIEAAAAGDLTLAGAARDALRQVRAELVADAPFVLRPQPGDVFVLTAELENRERPTRDRLQTLRHLTDMMVYGVAAMNEVQRTPQAPRIQEIYAVLRERLVRVLDESYRGTTGQ